MRNIRQQDIDLIKSTSLFDGDWYSQYYKDVGKIGIDPAYHFLWIGNLMNRDPSLHFSTKEYARNYPDVAAAKVNCLVHYIRHGASEGRKIFPVTDV